jgi:hypothetical protein
MERGTITRDQISPSYDVAIFTKNLQQNHRTTIRLNQKNHPLLAFRTTKPPKEMFGQVGSVWTAANYGKFGAKTLGNGRENDELRRSSNLLSTAEK